MLRIEWHKLPRVGVRAAGLPRRSSDEPVYWHETVSQLCHAFAEPGGHGRKRWDTRGHDIRPVRDREVPGSNPGPPTRNRIQIEVFACSVWRVGLTGRSQIFLGLGCGSPVQVDFEPSIELGTAIAQPIYQHAHGPWTVRHPGSKIKGAVHAGVLARRTGRDRERPEPFL